MKVLQPKPLEDTEFVVTAAGRAEAERVRVRYDQRIEYPGGLLTLVSKEEIYWRGKQPNRQILKIESVDSGRIPAYRATLIEEKRLKWWEQSDVLSLFERIKELP